MNKYILLGKTTSENTAAMLNKPQDRRKIVQPLIDAFKVEMSEFLWITHPDYNFLAVINGKNENDNYAPTITQYQFKKLFQNYKKQDESNENVKGN